MLTAPLVLPRPTVGQPIPPHATYPGDEIARLFWQASFRCGRAYLRGPDASGRPVLVAHEREEAESYQRRLRVTKPRNFVGPILRRYNDLVFRKPPVRPSERAPFYVGLVDDASGANEPLDAFFRRALIRAQIDREAWILCDTLGADAPAGATTVAAVEASGARPGLRIVKAGAVVNWRELPAGDASIVAECWVLMRDAEGRSVCRMFDATTYVDAVLRGEDFTRGSLVVEAYGPAVVHGYTQVPLVRLRPCFDPLGEVNGSEGDSQAGPLAESQQAIVNLLSLTNEEVYNVTFSQMIAFGVSDAQVKDAKVGNNRVLCIPNPAGSVEMIGADPAQAASIRDSVADEVANLFRLAGVNPADASTAPASGLALAFRHNDLATIVAALALACEQAEAAMWALVGDAWGFAAAAPTQYQGKDPELPDFASEAQSMLGIVSNAALPPTIRRKVAERFAARNLSLTDEEAEKLGAEVDGSGALARSMAGDGEGGGAFPARKGKPAAVPALTPPAGELAPGVKVQDAAMNGAQIASLVELLASVATGDLAPEAAVLAITNAFPTIDEAEARRMVAAQAKLETEEPEEEPEEGPAEPPATPVKGKAKAKPPAKAKP